VSAAESGLYGAWDDKRQGGWQAPLPTSGPRPAAVSGPRPNYAAAAITDECRKVAEAPAGTRNPQLNTSSLKLGRLVAGGYATEDDVRQALMEAAVKCGLVQDDGLPSVMRTVNSGLRAGLHTAPRDAGPAMEAPAGPAPLTDVTHLLAPAGHPAPAEQHAVVTAEPAPQVDVSTYLRPGSFLLELPEAPEPVWGSRDTILWAQGEALMIAGSPGLGKTTLAGQLVRARMGLQPSVLELPVREGGRVLWLMMDRPQQIARSVRRQFSRADLEQFGDRLVLGWGPPPADLARNPELMAELCKTAGADTVVVDSLKDAVVKLTDDENAASYHRARGITVTAGVEVLELHHMTKRNADGKAPDSLADVYGSAWLTAGVGSCLVLTGDAGDPIVKAHHLKQPAEPWGPAELIHDHTRGVTSVHHRVDLLELLAITKVQTAESAARQLFGVEKPSKAQTEKARRRLEALCSGGMAVKRPGRAGGDGGSSSTTYHPHTLTDLTADLAP
jgi:hypothetical protein